jgi:hypothetical protein
MSLCFWLKKTSATFLPRHLSIQIWSVNEYVSNFFATSPVNTDMICKINSLPMWQFAHKELSRFARKKSLKNMILRLKFVFKFVSANAADYKKFTSFICEIKLSVTLWTVIERIMLSKIFTLEINELCFKFYLPKYAELLLQTKFMCNILPGEFLLFMNQILLISLHVAINFSYTFYFLRHAL